MNSLHNWKCTLLKIFGCNLTIKKTFKKSVRWRYKRGNFALIHISHTSVFWITEMWEIKLWQKEVFALNCNPVFTWKRSFSFTLDFVALPFCSNILSHCLNSNLSIMVCLKLPSELHHSICVTLPLALGNFNTLCNVAKLHWGGLSLEQSASS